MESPKNLKCDICKCRLINWTWDSRTCTICLDKIYRRRLIKKLVKKGKL